MATSASAPQQLDASIGTSSYHSAVPEYYASYPEASHPLPPVQLCLPRVSDPVMLVQEPLAKHCTELPFTSASWQC